ncbi:MAG: LytR family transcriptional regulator [Solirubrobacterales bacterium]|nr:LytR family transcriptional regulator [Solirubrobacterales bacterium]
MNDERPPLLWWGMWKRFAIAGVLIVALSGAATATVALNKITTLAGEVFPGASKIDAPKGLVTPEYGGGPQTFLILGSDRRSGSKNSEERESAPHSDTILLVRFDPEQGQTSVLSIPRDLLVNITTPSGQVDVDQKINAAYTIGSQIGGANEASVLAAQTIKREVFPGLRLNGIIDVNFKGFINVVDTLGCAYVNVDHHYLHEKDENGEEYTTINLEPGYQRLCYENALDYVRYRHDDSDFVRVARQQDFLRDLREQIDPTNALGQIETVAKAVGHAIRSNFPASASELILLSKLIAFSQTKPLRQVRFLTTDVNAQVNGAGSYVTSDPELEKETLERFLNGHEQLRLPAATPSPGRVSSHGHGHHPSHHAQGVSPAALNLVSTSSTGESEMVKAALEVPFHVLYPRLQPAQSTQEQVRAYTVKDQQDHRRHAYVIVWAQNPVLGGYYDFEASDWLNPPLFAHARTQMIGGRTYELIDDGAHIHVLGWRSGRVLYWLTNTLLEELSNSQMLAIAKSAQRLR